ncbi:prepilin-type N-terminal cleavage/methylation domain-containing protein [Ramlibacter tataouinensis]|nr:prepilin-type N-terminal cleavage/methylation domain-containing protein [Ramlibacter tataouinensis]
MAKVLKPMRGFTLIELLVVFSLLALLLSIAVPKYLGSYDQAREKVRRQNMETIRDALDKFRADQGRYPADLAEVVSKQYLRSVPLDPVSDSSSWVPVAHPSGQDAGVYDVLPPASTEAKDP